MALVNAVTGEPEKTGPSTAASPSADDPTPDATTSETAAPPLLIRVTGNATNVIVRVAVTGGEVLTKATLNPGETRRYSETPLQVVASDGGALEVVIYGKVQPPKPDGRRGQWFVEARR